MKNNTFSFFNKTAEKSHLLGGDGDIGGISYMFWSICTILSVTKIVVLVGTLLARWSALLCVWSELGWLCSHPLAHSVPAGSLSITVYFMFRQPDKQTTLTY